MDAASRTAPDLDAPHLDAGSSLPPALSGERLQTHGRAGRLGYYVAGEGRPLLLIHSINAAANAYEVKPVFDGMTGTRRVYAPDLPGFGVSERSDRHYDPRLYTDAVHDMLDVIAKDFGTEPVDALALSLSAEFLARAAMERPERFRSLALVTPTGFTRLGSAKRKPQGTTREIPGIHKVLSWKPWSQWLFDTLTSPKSIRYFLKRTWGSDNWDRGLADYDDLAAHQPGARYAPLAFLSGRLFSMDIRTVYETLRMPVWLAHGTKGDFKDFSGTGWLRDRSNWSVKAYPTGALAHFEVPGEFLADYHAFLRAAEVRTAAE